MIKKQIIVNGAGGRMGLEIVQLLKDHPGAELLAGANKANGKIFEKGLDEKMSAVVIDFSSPEGMIHALSWSEKNRVPFVSGTTGISKKDEESLKRAAGNIPVLWSPNMSIGVNLFLRIIESLGLNLKSFDLQLEEYHHSKKKDSPSGTAKLLQAALEKEADREMPPVLVGRGGGIVGIHKLWLMAEDEVLTVEHTAINRKVFARGAIEAAIWLASQEPGLFSMKDMLCA